jgi:cytochrome b561
MIVVAILALWLLDKTRIMVISFVPFHYLILILIALLAGIRLLWRSFSK